MTELIKINYDTEQPTVSARELHEKLNIETPFKKCRHYSGCMERDRGYPCTKYERRGSCGRDKDDPGVESKRERISEEDKTQS